VEAIVGRGVAIVSGVEARCEWVGARKAISARNGSDLAKRQFDFYASDLHNGNPYSATAEDSAVMRGRVYLSQFSGLERVYQGCSAWRTSSFRR